MIISLGIISGIKIIMSAYRLSLPCERTVQKQRGCSQNNQPEPFTFQMIQRGTSDGITDLAPWLNFLLDEELSRLLSPQPSCEMGLYFSAFVLFSHVSHVPACLDVAMSEASACVMHTSPGWQTERRG